MLDLVAAFIALTTLLTYVNYRFIRLPPTIGVMATALVFSLIVQGLSELGYPILEVEMQEIIRRIDFSEVLMTWFLPALLFAGALHVDLSDLRSYKWPIGLLATAGVLIATFVIGGLAYYTFPLFGWQVDFIYCLLFGALISPTDPIAVLGILKSAGAPKPLATTIVGESLFNDGTAVVVFAIILGILQLGEAPTVSATAILFVQEAIGGVLFGAVLGYGVFVMMRGIDQYQVEVMLTLALVIGGAALAARLHVSAPIAMVVAGLIIGNHGRHYAMSDETRRYVDKFWEPDRRDPQRPAVRPDRPGSCCCCRSPGCTWRRPSLSAARCWSRACSRWGRRSWSCAVSVAPTGRYRRAPSASWSGAGCAAASRWRWRCPCRWGRSAT